jgi:hypothetical protein
MSRRQTGRHPVVKSTRSREMYFDYDALRQQIAQGIVPEGLDPHVTVHDIDEVEALYGQPDENARVEYSGEELAELERMVWAKIRERAIHE